LFSKHLKTSQKKKVASYLDAEIKVAVRTNPKVSVSRSRKREGGKEGKRERGGKEKRIVYVEERGKMSALDTNTLHLHSSQQQQKPQINKHDEESQ